MKELEDTIIDLWNQGYRPPYTLTIGDGEGREVVMDVTRDEREITVTPRVEPFDPEWHDVGGEG